MNIEQTSKEEESIDFEERRQICRILYKIGALKFGTFKLTSGKRSPYYIDLRIVPSFPDVFRRICDIYIKLATTEIGTDNFKRIAGIPTGGMPFASTVAYKLKKPFLYARSAPRKHGRERSVEGILIPGDEVLLVDDLVTVGTSLQKAASAIRAEGGVVDHALALIDREEGGKENLMKDGITLHFLVTANEAATALHEIGAITDRELKTVSKQKKKQD